MLRGMNDKKLRIALAACVLAAVATVSGVQASGPAPAQAGINLAGIHGFDFLVGEWRVHHRRISAVSKKWVEFDGTLSLRLLMEGTANMEEHWLNSPDGVYRAIGLRSYDSKEDQWSIWWLDSRYPSRPLDPPARGRFENGVGSFYASFEQDGKKIIGRLQWSAMTKTSAHWEQASSEDDGKTWQPNWIMELQRVE
jgi:hypothetical protein